MRRSIRLWGIEDHFMSTYWWKRTWYKGRQNIGIGFVDEASLSTDFDDNGSNRDDSKEGEALINNPFALKQKFESPKQFKSILQNYPMKNKKPF